MSIIPKLIHVTPIKKKNKNKMTRFFCGGGVGIDKLILELMWNHEESRIVNPNLWKNSLEDLHYHILTQYKTAVIMEVWY